MDEAERLSVFHFETWHWDGNDRIAIHRVIVAKDVERAAALLVAGHYSKAEKPAITQIASGVLLVAFTHLFGTASKDTWGYEEVDTSVEGSAW